MAHQIDQTTADERTGSKTNSNTNSNTNSKTSSKIWALVIGCMYGSVTLFVAVMAVVRVIAAEPQSVSGYEAAVSLAAAPDRLVGDFWPAGARVPAPSTAVGT